MSRDSATLALGVGLVLLVVTLSIRHNMQWTAPAPAPAPVETPSAAAGEETPLPASDPLTSAGLPAAPAAAPARRAAAPVTAQPAPAAPPSESEPREQPDTPAERQLQTPVPAGGAADPPTPARREPRQASDAVRAALNLSMQVVHRHRFGSCDGTLSASGDRLAYAAGMDDDAFELAFAEIDRFEVDRQTRNLRVRRRGGRTWNFTVRDDNVDALLAFHGDVERARSRAAAR